MHLPDLALARPPSSAFAAPADLPAEAQIGRVDLFTSLDQARSDWAELEAIAPSSPYQQLAFADAWFATIGAAIGAAPFIVVAREPSGAPGALLPLALRRRGPFALATFLGGKDSNFNLGLFRPGPSWSASGLRSAVLEAARASPAHVDCVALLNQPRAWQYFDNPLVALGGRASPSFGYKTKLPTTFGAWRDTHVSKVTRRKLRRLAERLARVGPVAHVVARSEAEVDSSLRLSSRTSVGARGMAGPPTPTRAKPRKPS